MLSNILTCIIICNISTFNINNIYSIKHTFIIFYSNKKVVFKIYIIDLKNIL